MGPSTRFLKNLLTRLLLSTSEILVFFYALRALEDIDLVRLNALMNGVEKYFWCENEIFMNV